MSTTSWSNGSGDRYSEHAHDYDKVLVVARGSITFTLPTEEVVLGPGDRLELPAGTPHGAVVGPEGVECVETHLPHGSFEAVAHHESEAARRADDHSP